MKSFNRFLVVYKSILSVIGSGFFLTFCACVLIQIIARNLLPSAPSWTEEAARYSFIYMCAFGCGIAMLKDEFVYVEFLRDKLEEKGLHKLNTLIRFGITAAMLVLSLFVLLKAEPSFVFMKFRMVSTAMQLPMQWVYFSQILMFGMLSLSAVLRLVMMLRDWNKTPEEIRRERELEEKGGVR